MSGRPRRAAAVEAMNNIHHADGDEDDASPVANGRRGGRSRRVLDEMDDDDDDDDDDDAGAPRRSARARKPVDRLGAGEDDDDVEGDEDEDDDDEAPDHFVRRSARAAKPVARLSPEWKAAASDGEDAEEPETEEEGEYEEESEEPESEEIEDEDDEDAMGIQRYSRRQRNTIQRYSPKPHERGLAGGGGRGSESPKRSRGRPRSGGGGARPNGRPRRSRDDDDGGYYSRPGRGGGGGRGHRWMDDTDDSDAGGGDGGGFPALDGGGPWGSRAPDPYPLVPQGGGGGANAVAGGPGANEGKEAAGAEITPLTVDPTLTFEQVGGLSHYVHSLKEMVFLPLLYPEVFARFKMSPPRGVLLYGAPGTGKTLIARALAASCSRAGAEVSFFMRKGADVLSKWVGESERQLRLLFAEAQKRQPAIIFFDEIDGLAPVRSSKTDQIHNSIVATLLALMDGLDSRGRVVVLGATNRVDAIDGALRRPGRFDRELAFPLPNAGARLEILKIHTKAWERPPPALLLEQLATRCVGYCGADLKALCTEAAVHALRRRYPQIYESDDKLIIDPGQVVPGRVDFRAAMDAITPASHRAAQAHARPLGPLRSPLMGPALEEALETTRLVFPPAAMAANAAGVGDGGSTYDLDDLDDLDDDDEALLDELDRSADVVDSKRDGRAPAPNELSGASAAAALAAAALEFVNCPLARQPRLLLAGSPGAGQTPLAAALLHELEAFPVHAVGLPSLLADGGRSPEEALVGAVTEARRAAPAVLFLPHLRLWWDSASRTLRATLRTLMEDVPSDLPLLLLATCDCAHGELDDEAAELFGEGQVVPLKPPETSARVAYLAPVVAAAARAARSSDVRARHLAVGGGDETARKKKRREREVLEKAPVAAATTGEGDEGRSRPASDAATAAMLAEEDHALRQQRMFLRDVITRLLYSKQWRDFHVPVSEEELPGYGKVVKDPMDLSTLLWRVDSGWYLTVDAFLRDAHLIVAAAKTYWGGLGEGEEENARSRDLEGRQIVSRAHALEDTVQEMAGQLDPGLVQKCVTIARHRAARAAAAARAGAGAGAGADGSEALPLMPGEGPKGERRSRRGVDAEYDGGENGDAGAGEKRSREVFAQPGYVADPEVIAREARKKRQKEEAEAKEAAATAEAERQAAESASATIAAAAEAAAVENGAPAKAPGETESAPQGSAPAPAPASTTLDLAAHAAAPPPMSETELAEACERITAALVARTEGFPAAEVEAAASGLGRAAKAATAAAKGGPRTRRTLEEMEAFAREIGRQK